MMVMSGSFSMAWSMDQQLVNRSIASSPLKSRQPYRILRQKRSISFPPGAIHGARSGCFVLIASRLPVTKFDRTEIHFSWQQPGALIS